MRNDRAWRRGTRRIQAGVAWLMDVGKYLWSDRGIQASLVLTLDAVVLPEICAIGAGSGMSTRPSRESIIHATQAIISLPMLVLAGLLLVWSLVRTLATKERADRDER